jgi:uncharacterized membrane protein YqgA involved in biofilm formation
MMGTWLNVGGILIGGLAGLTFAHRLSEHTQRRMRAVLGALTVYVGLSMVWESISLPVLHGLKQLGIALLALVLGNLTGRILHFQRGVNKLGRLAAERFARSRAGGKPERAEGFVTATLVFCVGPMAILGSVQEGLTGDWRTLGLKALLDGLGTMGFVLTLGWPAMLSALPVLAYQGLITMAAQTLAPHLQEPALRDSFTAVSGMIVATVSLVILDLRKVPLADYLPALVWAPLLTAWWN